MNLRKDAIPFQTDFDTIYLNFINIGIGDCLLLGIPFSRKRLYVLIDTGLGNYDKITSFMEKFGIKQIDYTLITHLHDDHISNIKSLLHDNPNMKVWISKYYNDENEQFIDLIYSHFDQLQFVDWIDITPVNLLPELSPAIKLELIGPTRSFIDKLIENEVVTEETLEIETASGTKVLKDFIFGNLDNDQENNLSLILKITYAGAISLLTGDAESDAYEAITPLIFPESEREKKTKNINFLKLGHHGSKNAIPITFTNMISPQYALVTTYTNVKQRYSINFAKKILDVEECYRLGYTERRNRSYRNHISSTFAIKQNKSKKGTIIIPMIYKVFTKTSKEIYFIRPSDIETC